MNSIRDLQSSISPAVSSPVITGVDIVSPATINARQLGQYRDGWQRWIDVTLMDWLQDPSQLEDIGVDAPAGTIIRLALDYAEKFRDEGLPPPDAVVADPNGGIVFEHRQNEVVEVFHFWDDGTLEYQRYDGTRLVERSAA